jgi:hypothetical protein
MRTPCRGRGDLRLEHRPQPVEGLGVLGLDGPGRAAEDPRGLGDVEVEEVAQDDHRPLSRRQRPERGQDGVRQVVLVGGRLGEGVGGGLPAVVRAALLVDERVGQAGACVPHRVAGPAYPRPVEVEPGERGLHEVLRGCLVAGGEQPSHAHQRGALGGDELDELGVTLRFSHRSPLTSLTGATDVQVACI